LIIISGETPIAVNTPRGVPYQRSTLSADYSTILPTAAINEIRDGHYGRFRLTRNAQYWSYIGPTLVQCYTS